MISNQNLKYISSVNLEIIDMQRPETYQIRNAVLGELLKVGPLTLSDLEIRIGLPKSKIRYAIESTRPFEEVFWKYYVGRTCKYGAIL